MTPPIVHEDLPLVPRGEIDYTDPAFLKFSAQVPIFSLDRPLDPIYPPDTFVTRINHRIMHIDLPGDDKIEAWGFEDPDAEEPISFPSPIVRLTEGDLFHCHDMHHPEQDEDDDHCPDRKWVEGHTIHWHGIEPVTSSDGVGKLSFGVRDLHGPLYPGEYTYQWRAAHAGTYFYHCHRNTVLHFEMGMYGGLIVDPPPPRGSQLTAPYVTGGPGFTRRGNALIPYHMERIWIADDMDSFWHDAPCEDTGLPPVGVPFNPPPAANGLALNVFEPDHFFISGVPHPWTETDPRIVARVRVGETLLLRIICASYLLQTWTIGLDAEVIAMDGRTLGNSAQNPYGSPFTLRAGTPFELSTALRRDLLVVV
jgi:FtsP/CotA-like multicopper oxidase with cupredoxin domain